MRYAKAILTGCDKNTEWQLPWFLANLRKHNPDVDVLIANFGMTDRMVNTLGDHTVFDVSGNAGWFKKPQAMIQAAHYADKVIWMDTDCEVRKDISRVFDIIEEEMLLIAVDRPLNKRQPVHGCWHNSGVVGYEGVPKILTDWAKACQNPKQRGDQEVLHAMFGGNEILKSKYLKTLPSTYNTLRIDILDGVAEPDPAVMHWTGPKGNQVIKEQINGDPLAGIR